MHYWGDDWPYWNDLYIAELYIHRFVKRFSGCTLMSKEKYGSIRYEWVFAPGDALFLKRNIWYILNPFKPIAHSDYGPYPNYLKFPLWVRAQWVKLGHKVLAIAIHRAVKKWPHLKEELTEDLY